MTTIIILSVVGAALLGAGFCLLAMKAKTKGNNSKNDKEDLLKQKNALEKSLNESKSKIASLEERLDVLLKSSSAPTNPNKLAEIDTLKKKIKQLEEEAKVFESNLEETGEKLKKKTEECSTLSNSCVKQERELKTLQDEASTLKKKIKQLEEELEECESDLDETRKKLKKKTEECTTLSDSCTKLERELKTLQDETTTLKETLAQKEEDLKLKGESLNFVQEILSAKEFSSGDKNETYRRVDSLKDFIAGELHDTIKVVGMDGKIDQYFFGEGLTKWEILKKKDWVAGKTAIAFVGEFSAGKTSIVNRILSQDDPTVPQLPVSTKATTAIPTYISGGIKTEFEFFSHDNKLKKIEKSTFMRVNKEVLDEVGGVSNLIQYFVMEYKNEKLNHISILDTPGFSSNDDEDSKRTIEVINECDALFWVFDVNVGTVNRSSLKLMKEHLRKPLYVVINKVEDKTKKEIKEVEDLIRKTFNDEGVSVQGILAFSKKAPLEDIMATIGSIKGSSTQVSFLNDLRDAVQKIATDIENVVRKQSQNHQACRHRTESISASIRSTIQSTKTDSEEAKRIPQYKEILWHKYYKMTPDQFNNLKMLLDRINDSRMPQLTNLSNELIDASKKEQAALEAYKTASFNSRRINEVLNKLSIKINELTSK